MTEPTQEKNNTEVVKNKSLYWDKIIYEKSRQDIIGNFKRNDIIEKIVKNMKIDDTIIQAIKSLNERRNNIVKNYSKKHILIDGTFKLRTKLLLGSGLPSLIEVGIHLSRNYGIPVIPATSIKGAFAHYLLEKMEEEKTITEELYKKIFGTDLNNPRENQRGLVIFLDALPQGDMRIEIDLINNHFQPYYMKQDNPPNDWYSPVPVQYIVVGASTYRFTILLDKESNFTEEEKNKIKTEFKNMLKLYGIGAKTNYGYGRFEPQAES